MPLTLYEGAILLQHPGQGPTNHYRFEEALGTNVNDTGIAQLDLTTNGTPGARPAVRPSGRRRRPFDRPEQRHGDGHQG